MRRTIAAARLASALGLALVTVGAGQTRSTKLGLSVGLTTSTLNRSALVIAPSARVILDDGVTADSLSVEGLFRSFHLLAGPSNW
jgi:hypothetical protein